MPFSSSLGQGQAQVLGPQKDPLSIYLSGERNKAANALRQQQIELANKKQQDAEVGKVLAYKYEDPGERFRVWGQDVINKANQSVMGLFQSNPDADINSLRPSILGVQGQAQKDLNLAKEINNIYDEKKQSINAISNVDKKAAESLLNSAISKNSPYEVDRDFLENIESVPAIYDLNSLVADSVSNIKDQFRGTDIGEIQKSPLGLFMEITDNKVRFKDIDATMDFLLRGDDITDLGVSQKVNGGVISDRIRWDIAKDEVARSGADANDPYTVMDRFKEIQYDKKYAPTVREKLRGILDQLNQEERDVKVQSMGRFKQTSGREQDYERSKMKREEVLMNLTNPFGRGNNLTAPTPESQRELGRLRNTDFAGGKITDARFEKGSYVYTPEDYKKINEILISSFSGKAGTPEAYKQFSNAIKEAEKRKIPSKGNQIKFTAKTGTIFGQPETLPDIPLDLNNPDAMTILNGMLNTNPNERKIYFDDLFQNKETDIGLIDEDGEFELDLTD